MIHSGTLSFYPLAVAFVSTIPWLGLLCLAPFALLSGMRPSMIRFDSIRFDWLLYLSLQILQNTLAID